jgi:predicted RNase H-like nuclease
MHFIGLDLAWSSRNPTGGAVLSGAASGARLVEARLLTDDASILAFVDGHAPDGPAIVGIDAPLWVPNETGKRPAETELGAVFGRYQAGAHPANRQHLTNYNGGVVRGEAITAALEARGFVHDPLIPAGQPVRRVVEVYPHPAMVALFGLTRTLKYKRKSQGAVAMHAAWQQYHGHLAALSKAEPSLTGLDDLLTVRPSELIGARLKNHEDVVDAVMCAYIALYAHRWGPARTELFGTLADGYILTPTLPARWSADD